MFPYHFQSHPTSSYSSQPRYVLYPSTPSHHHSSFRSATSYESFDVQRSARELYLLEQRQQARREAEEEAFLARQYYLRQQEREKREFEAWKEEQRRERRRQHAVAREEVVSNPWELIESLLGAFNVDATPVPSTAKTAAAPAKPAVEEKADKPKSCAARGSCHLRRHQFENQEDFVNPFELLKTILEAAGVDGVGAETATVNGEKSTTTTTSSATERINPTPSAQSKPVDETPFPFHLLFDFSPFGEPSPSPSSSSTSSTPSTSTTLERTTAARHEQLSTLFSLSSSLDSFKNPSEEFLNNLLSKIDEIESGGDEVLRSARKELVGRVEGLLKTLEEEKAKVVEGKGKGKADVYQDELDLDYIPPLLDEQVSSKVLDIEVNAPSEAKQEKKQEEEGTGYVVV